MERNNHYMISTENLCFSLGSEMILKDISLKVPNASIYGFLGPNGAGKSTTIKLLLGLLEGEGKQPLLFGRNIRQYRVEILSKTGALIEQPSLYEHLTAFENLTITARYRQIEKKRIAEVLDLVKLAEHANKKINNFSLGMKQRMGLALALMGKPELLILDEPVNGLDPKGIVETRELLLQLNRDLGITIFLSSHLLTEIEKMVTHIGIINEGKLIFQGTTDELTLKGQNETVVRIMTNNQEKVMGILGSICQGVKLHEKFIDFKYLNHEQIYTVTSLLSMNGCPIYHLEIIAKNLENIFLDLTSNVDETV